MSPESQDFRRLRRGRYVGGVGSGSAEPSGIRVDRPFLLAIRERLSGTILFLGVSGGRDPSPDADQLPAVGDSETAPGACDLRITRCQPHRLHSCQS